MELSCSVKVGLATKRPSISATRTAPTGPLKGISEIIRAAEAALIARISIGLSRIDREGIQDHLHVVAQVFGEERSQGAVGQASGQDGFFAGATFAAEERAGDAPTGVHALFIIDGQREKIDPGADFVAHGGGSEDHGIPHTEGDCAAGLSGQATSLERINLTIAGKLEGFPSGCIVYYSPVCCPPGQGLKAVDNTRCHRLSIPNRRAG